MTKLSSSLPEEHGLADINDVAIKKPQTPFVVVGVVIPSKITTDLWKKREEATVAFESVEVLTGDAANRALDLLREAQEERTGSVALPLDNVHVNTDGISTITFTRGSVDPETGELKED